MISTTCALFNTVINSDSCSSREDKLTNIIEDDFGAFTTCCKQVINDETVKTVSLTVIPSEKTTKGHYVVERI